MKLQEYIETTGLTPMSFARKCGLTPALVYHALSGVKRIEITTALIIEKMSNGDVQALDLCKPEVQEKIKRLESPFKKLKK